jgi:FKBP12-rapamycin complex-associated protein
MSIVGYILGLGDRHPSNLMMNRKTGKIIHIDFGDCFEVAMKRDKFPEKVPFRLTRILIKALEVSEIEGTFRLICEKIMELLRDNKDSLMAILGSFLHDPLISFRLMVPMIMKNKKDIDIFEDKMKHKRMTIKKNIEKKNSSNKNNISISMKITNNPVARMSRIINPYNETVAETIENDKKMKKGKREKKVLFKLKEEKEEDKEKEKPESINEDQEKNEKKKMESDERQIFNQYEENDEIDLEELNKIAQIVLDRIQDKLSGTDFNPEIVYDVKSQVNKLIQQATSNENLAQSYLGWCPFW